MPARLLCPSCKTSLKAPATLPPQVRCPRCKTRFNPRVAEEAPARGDGPSGSGPSTSVILGVCGAGALVLLLLVGGIVLLTLPKSKSTEVVEANPTAPEQPGPRFGQTADPYADQADHREDDKDPPAPPPLPLPPPPPPPDSGPPKNPGARWTAPLAADQQDKVNTAIDRGVEYVKKELNGPATAGRNGRLGAVALGGLTLLACGAPANDPAVQKALTRVRAESENNTATYDIALSILFLDRLDDKQDSDLIQDLALRLVAGQTAGGSWTYGCPRLSPSDQKQLLAYLEKLSPPSERIHATAGDGKGKTPVVPDKTPPSTQKTTPGKRPSTPPTTKSPRPPAAPPAYNTANLAISKWEPGKPLPAGSYGDNSNAQFALLAVWAAQRHGVPVERSLAMVEAHFRDSQNDDGTWGYAAKGKHRTDSMTCAGLLGLAVGRGLIRGDDAKKAAAKDQAVEKAMASLGRGIDRMTAGPANFTPGKPRPVNAVAWGDLYYLWSLERVGVVYERKEVGGKDWYTWGAQALVETQMPDGSWADAFRGLPDTCFALLFLKRANVATDLTEQLKTINLLDRVSDPKMP